MSGNLEQAYKSIQNDLQSRLDDRLGKGAFKKALQRMVLWHSPIWFGPAATSSKADPPDPLKREERIISLVSSWLEPDVVGMTAGHGGLFTVLGISSLIGPDNTLTRIGRELFEFNYLGDSFDEIGRPATVFCLDYLECQARGKGVSGFLLDLARATGEKTSLILADHISYQDDAVENLVALDYEILKLKSVSSLALVVMLARR